MKRAGILLLLLLPAQAATLWALPDCSAAVAVCHMGPDGESCCPPGDCSTQECGAPAPEVVLVVMPSLPPVSSFALPRPAASGLLVPGDLPAPSSPSPEILDPPPRA